jgi:16S rRNA (uracil1498-N3)-methyltransferase
MDDTSRTPNAKAPTDTGPRTRPRRLWQPDVAGVSPGDAIELEPEEAQHAVKVLRMREGDAVELINGRGTVAIGILTQAKARQTTVRVDATSDRPAPHPVLTVLAAPPKGTRLESMVGMLVQVGVSRLVLLDTRRSVTEPRTGKLQRLHRVVIEACKQSGRAWSMDIEGPTPLETVLAHPAPQASAQLIATMQSHAGNPRHDLPESLRTAAEVRVLIGPEGGFTPEEEHAAQAAGYEPWQMGASIMRIETAAVAAAAVLRWALRDHAPPEPHR